jgi:hypothetical protein
MKNPDSFFLDLPRDEKAIAVRLREIIFQSVPDFEEKFSYGVPYYFRRGRVLCIWPASAPGGPKRGVFLGICRGYLMSNIQGLIEMGNRKQFGLIRYFDVKEIVEEPLFEIIQEAVMVDESLSKGRRKGKGKRAM